MNKKSIELAMNTIVVAAILLIVMFIIIFVFHHYYGKETGFIGEKIEELDDYDGDGTANMFDKCPCDVDIEENCKDKKTCEKEMKNYYKTKK